MSGGGGLGSLVWNGSYSSAYQDWLGIQADAPSPLTNSLAGHKRRRRSIKEHFELGTPVPKTLRRNYLRLFLDGLSQQLDGLDGRGVRWRGGCWDVDVCAYIFHNCDIQSKRVCSQTLTKHFLNSVRPSSTVYMKWLSFVRPKMNSFTKFGLLFTPLFLLNFAKKNLLSCVPFSYTPLISKEHDGDDVNKGTE